ncbi:L-type lectin-domain containing receptor kinase IX.1-like [Fagus crenata]
MVFWAPKLLIQYWMITSFLFLINPCATQISFNYTDFSQTNNNKPVIITGNATVSGSVIQLTPDKVDNWGRATYFEPMLLWDKKSGKLANFTTNFSFIIDSQGKDSYSDGLTFFLASPNFPPPTPTDGSGIGLLSGDQLNNPSFLAANQFVAVEFDTFRNDEWDPRDPVREHVGININEMKSQNSTPWYCTIKENRTYSASINYDSSNQNFSVTFTGFNNDSSPIQQHLSSIVNLTEHLPEFVEFGFSSSTGLISESHILCSWSFVSTSLFMIQQPPPPPPNKTKDDRKTKLVAGLSVGACILISGLVLVWLMYTRKWCRGKEEELGLVLSMDNEFERACGRKPIDPMAEENEISMIEWVWDLYGTRNLLRAADPRLRGDFDEQQMERLMVVGLWCAHPDYIVRPSIRKVIHVLDFEAALPILEPKMPLPTYLTPPILASTSSANTSEKHKSQSSNHGSNTGSSL